MAAMDFPASPAVGQSYVAPGGAPSYVWNGTAWVSVGSPIGIDRAGFRNAVINGAFDVQQRAALAAGTGLRYGPVDRWVAGSGGTTMTLSAGQLALGQVPYEPRYYLLSTVASVAGAANYAAVSQRIEGVRTLAGQQVTASFWASADAPKPVSIEFRQFFGTGGSPSADVLGIGATKFNLTTTQTRYSVTFTVPSIAGKTIGSNNDDYLEIVFWLDAGSNYSSRNAGMIQQSGSFYFSQVQLEPGPIATPFEKRPFTTEQQLCRRYYQAHYGLLFSSYAAASGVFYQEFMLPVEMRAAPTVVVSNTAFANSSALILHGAYTSHVRLQATMTAAGSGWATGDITCTAEL